MKAHMLSILLSFISCAITVQTAQAFPVQVLTPCAAIWEKNIPCSASLLAMGLNPVLAHPTSRPASPAIPMPAWGDTPAQIQANFPRLLAANFAANPYLDAQMTIMDSMMLARLSTELLALDHGGYTGQALIGAAKKLSVANLRRLTSAFGPTLMAQALPYAQPTVRVQYEALAALPPAPMSSYGYTQKHLAIPALPNASIYDTFLLAWSQGHEAVQTSIHRAIAYNQMKVKNVVVDVIAVSAGVVAIVQAFDPTFFQDAVKAVKTWWNSTTTAPTASIPTLIQPDPAFSPLPPPQDDLPSVSPGNDPTFDTPIFTDENP